jgi:hypothetical protein
VRILGLLLLLLLLLVCLCERVFAVEGGGVERRSRNKATVVVN